MKPATSLFHKRAPLPRRSRGFTLIDVLVLITLLGIVAGSMTVIFMRMASQSAEVMRTRQAITVAQALLNEIRLMPFTNCDLRAAGCSATPEAMGPEAGEVRYHTATTTLDTRFDNPNDYNGLVQPGPGCAGICDIKGNVLNPAGSALRGCTSVTAVAPQAMASGLPNTEAVLISVTVDCPGSAPLTLQAIRTKHAPTIF